MKSLKINFAAIALFVAMCAFTSCTEGSLVETIEPENSQTTYEYEALASGPLHLSGRAITWINREAVEGHSYDGGPESIENTGLPEENTLWSYHLGGYDTLTIEKIGTVSFEYTISTNPYTQSARGELTIQSLQDKHSVMRYQIVGSDQINEMSSQKGYEMQLTLTSADGGFAQAARKGNGVLSASGEDSGGQMFSQLDIYLNNE